MLPERLEMEQQQIALVQSLAEQGFKQLDNGLGIVLEGRAAMEAFVEQLRPPRLDRPIT